MTESHRPSTKDKFRPNSPEERRHVEMLNTFLDISDSLARIAGVLDPATPIDSELGVSE